MSDIKNIEKLHLSRIVFGVMKWGVWGHNLPMIEMQKLIEESIELGVTSFDHADIYGHYTTEAAFGEALKNRASLREKIEIVTKCGINLITPNRPNYKVKSYDSSRSHILKSVETSLKNLHTDYIDLLLIHRPSPLMNPMEIAETFHELRQAGKVKFFGVSNFTPSQFEMLNGYFKLETNQVEGSVLHYEPFFDGTFDQCLKNRIAPMVWSPLGGGQVFTDLEDEQVKRIRKVAENLGEKYDADIDQILLAWLLKHPSKIHLVLGTARIGRVKKAVDAMQIDLTQEEWFELLEAARGHEVA
jgi:predicted oxidoreductase